MGTTTIIDTSATLAKQHAAEICRLSSTTSNNNNDVRKFVARSDAEFRAYIDAEIAAARVPWDRAPVRFDTGDDDELVEPAVPVRRQRKRSPSLTKALREAKKAGISVTGATFTADGSVSLSFGEAVKSNGNDLDQWLAGHHENPTKGH
jgi:hypothetical protein